MDKHLFLHLVPVQPDPLRLVFVLRVFFFNAFHQPKHTLICSCPRPFSYPPTQTSLPCLSPHPSLPILACPLSSSLTILICPPSSLYSPGFTLTWLKASCSTTQLIQHNASTQSWLGGRLSKCVSFEIIYEQGTASIKQLRFEFGILVNISWPGSEWVTSLYYGHWICTERLTRYILYFSEKHQTTILSTKQATYHNRNI